MHALLRQRAVSVLLVLGGCSIGPAALLHFLGPREVHIGPEVHFLPIAVSAGLAAGAAVALTLVGARRGDGRAVLVGTAFSAMAALLAVHGLTTPGLLAGENGVVAFTGAATLPVGGAVLALSAVPEIRRPRNISRLLWLQGALLLLVAGVGAAGILAPAVVPGVPEPRSTLAWIVLAIGMVFYGMLALRAARTFLLTRRQADLLVVLGIMLLLVALVPALLWRFSDLGWWLGHGFELVGIGLVGVPVALDLHRGAQSRPLAGDLRGTEFVRAADAFLGPSVRALLVRLGEKDAYTEAHTRGVALRAVQVGEELGLPRGRLRELAIGALVHDVGKLSVPNAILQKPASLDHEEVCGHQAPSAVGLGAGGRAWRLLPARLTARARPPRAARRLGLSARLARGRARPGDAGARGVRRLRRADLPAGVPRGLDPGRRPGASAPRGRHWLRSALRQGARAGPLARDRRCGATPPPGDRPKPRGGPALSSSAAPPERLGISGT
jgi:hypothetical protein